jgi:hypothetical protein
MATETHKPSSSRAAIAAIVLVAAGLSLAGCGKKRDIGEIYGTVTFQGRPVTEGTVVFADEEWGTFLRASIRADGSYVLRPTKDGPFVKGEYDVTVVPLLEEAPVGITKTPPKVRDPRDIPAKYRDSKTSGLKFKLTKAREQFDVPMK